MLDAAASAQQKPGKQARVGESRGGVHTSTGTGGGDRTPEGSADIPMEGVAVPSAPIDGSGVAVASAPHEELAARSRRLDAFGVAVVSAPCEGDELDLISFEAYEAAEAERPKVDWQQDERKCLEELGLDHACHDDILGVIAAIGDGVHVSEVVSTPRSTTRCNRLGLRAGLAMDLRTRWDFSLPKHRRKA